MAEILLTSLEDALGGPLPADAVLTATATKSRSEGQDVIANSPITIPLKSGVPEYPVELDASGVDWCWHLVLVFPELCIRIDRYVEMPPTDVEWADLVDIDPETLVPSTGAVPAWTAAVGQVTTALADTVEARDGAVLARGIAEIARDGAVVAQGASEAARDQAEVFAAGTVALQDTAIAQAMNTPGSETQTQLNATIVTGIETPGAPMQEAVRAVVPRTTAHVPLVVPTTDGDPSTGHPSVLHAPNGWNGYKYWMAHTPFPASPRENPHIAASNDGVNWVTPVGLVNPIAALADAVSMGYDYWADTELAWSPDGSALWCYFKGTKTGVRNEYVRMTSTDGVTWTGPTVVVPNAPGLAGAAISPAIVREDDDTYTMFEVGDYVRRRTSADGLTWTDAVNCTHPVVPAEFSGWWHLGVTKVDGVYHALVSANVPTGTGPYRLFHWISADGLTWTSGTGPAIPLSGTRFDTRGHYRATLMPAISGADGRFDVWLTCMDDTRTNHDNSIWRIGHLRDCDLSGGAEWSFAAPVQHEVVRETDERWVMAGEITTLSAGTPVGIQDWPSKGARHNAVDILVASFPPMPDSWHFFTIDVLVAAESTGAAEIGVRVEQVAVGGTLTTGVFNTGFNVDITDANRPQWAMNVGTSAGNYGKSRRVIPGGILRLRLNRNFALPADSLDNTLHVLAVRVRRVRGNSA